MFLSFLLSPPSFSQQIADTGWKVINKDVYKKDTSGRVVIGNTEITEKLNVAGEVRIDGLKGVSYRLVYADQEGKLKTDKGGVPDWVKLPDGPGGDGISIGSGTNVSGTILGPCAWQDNKNGGFSTVCKVGIGTNTPVSDLEIVTPGAFNGNTIVGVTNTNNHGAGFLLSGDGEAERTWMIQSTGTYGGASGLGAGKLLFGTGGTKGLVLSKSEQGYKTEIFGGLDVYGNIIANGDLEITSSGNYAGNTLPVIRNLGNAGAGFHFIPGGGGKEWIIHATGPDNTQGTNKLIFKTSDTATVLTLTTDGVGKAEIDGDLNVTGNLTVTSLQGINFTDSGINITGNLNATGNIITSGYLQSGNSIYIDGTQVGGTDQSNKIYSEQNLLSILGGSPGAPDEGNIKIGIGMNPTLTDAKFTIKGSPAPPGSFTSHFKIINAFDEDIFNIDETLLPAGMDYTLTGINIGNTKSTRGLTNINLNGVVNINGGLMHVCTDQACNVNLNNVFVNDQTFHIQSNVGEDVNIHLETKNGNSWVIFSKDDKEIIENWCSIFGWCAPDIVDVNYFGIYDSQTGETPFLIDPMRKQVYITYTLNTPNLNVCGTITAGQVTVKNTWCDYVFDKDYNLSDLGKVKDYIALNKHLPEIPSAKEIEEKGLNLGSMMELVMKKIEEIFLYLFKHEERLDTHDEELKDLRDENFILKMKLNEQERKLDSLLIVFSKEK